MALTDASIHADRHTTLVNILTHGGNKRDGSNLDYDTSTLDSFQCAACFSKF